MKKKQNYQLNNKLKQTNLMDGKNLILKEDMVTDEIPDSSIANPMFEKNENENKNGSDYENKNEKDCGWKLFLSYLLQNIIMTY